MKIKWRKIKHAPTDGSVILGFHALHKVPVTIYYTGNCWRERTLTTEWPYEAFSHWSKIPNQPPRREQVLFKQYQLLTNKKLQLNN